MTHGQAKHHRRSIRLQGYDYSQPGAYFVTICTQNSEYLFGDITDGEMVLSGAGRMVQSVWDELPMNYSGIETDAFIIMPNHIHGIITIQPSDMGPSSSPVGAGPRACPDDAPQSPDVGAGPRACPDDAPQSPDVGAGPRACPPHRMSRKQPPPAGHAPPPAGQPQGVAPTKTMSLPDVVHRFKTLTTKRYTDGVKHNGWKPFPGRLWQRNYWEHVVSNERELHRIREYISTNPAKWELDRLYHPPSGPANKVREHAAEYAVEEWMV